MVDDIVKYGKLDAERFDQPDEIKDFLYETAREYDFVNVDEDHELDVDAGIIGPTGDLITLNPDYIENNALTYLDPKLMKRKIETEVEFLRGTYESSFGLSEEIEREQLLDKLSTQLDEKYRQTRDNLIAYQDGELPEDELIKRNTQLNREIERLTSKSDMVNRASASQGMLYMINEEVNKGNDPLEAIAVNQYNPSLFSRDSLEGYFEIVFREDFTWLNEDSRTQVIESIEDINQRLEEQAAQFE